MKFFSVVEEEIQKPTPNWNRIYDAFFEDYPEYSEWKELFKFEEQQVETKPEKNDNFDKSLETINVDNKQFKKVSWTDLFEEKSDPSGVKKVEYKPSKMQELFIQNGLSPSLESYDYKKEIEEFKRRKTEKPQIIDFGNHVLLLPQEYTILGSGFLNDGFSNYQVSLLSEKSNSIIQRKQTPFNITLNVVSNNTLEGFYIKDTTKQASAPNFQLKPTSDIKTFDVATIDVSKYEPPKQTNTSVVNSVENPLKKEEGVGFMTIIEPIVNTLSFAGSIVSYGLAKAREQGIKNALNVVREAKQKFDNNQKLTDSEIQKLIVALHTLDFFFYDSEKEMFKKVKLFDYDINTIKEMVDKIAFRRRRATDKQEGYDADEWKIKDYDKPLWGHSFYHLAQYEAEISGKTLGDLGFKPIIFSLIADIITDPLLYLHPVRAVRIANIVWRNTQYSTPIEGIGAFVKAISEGVKKSFTLSDEEYKVLKVLSKTDTIEDIQKIGKLAYVRDNITNPFIDKKSINEAQAVLKEIKDEGVGDDSLLKEIENIDLARAIDEEPENVIMLLDNAIKQLMVKNRHLFEIKPSLLLTIRDKFSTLSMVSNIIDNVLKGEGASLLVSKLTKASSSENVVEEIISTISKSDIEDVKFSKENIDKILEKYDIKRKDIEYAKLVIDDYKKGKTSEFDELFDYGIVDEEVFKKNIITLSEYLDYATTHHNKFSLLLGLFGKAIKEIKSFIKSIPVSQYGKVDEATFWNFVLSQPTDKTKKLVDNAIILNADFSIAEKIDLSFAKLFKNEKRNEELLDVVFQRGVIRDKKRKYQINLSDVIPETFLRYRPTNLKKKAVDEEYEEGVETIASEASSQGVSGIVVDEVDSFQAKSIMISRIMDIYGYTDDEVKKFVDEYLEKFVNNQIIDEKKRNEILSKFSSKKEEVVEFQTEYGKEAYKAITAPIKKAFAYSFVISETKNHIIQSFLKGFAEEFSKMIVRRIRYNNEKVKVDNMDEIVSKSIEVLNENFSTMFDFLTPKTLMYYSLTQDKNLFRKISEELAKFYSDEKYSDIVLSFAEKIKTSIGEKIKTKIDNEAEKVKKQILSDIDKIVDTSELGVYNRIQSINSKLAKYGASLGTLKEFIETRKEILKRIDEIEEKIKELKTLESTLENKELLKSIWFNDMLENIENNIGYILPSLKDPDAKTKIKTSYAEGNIEVLKEIVSGKKDEIITNISEDIINEYKQQKLNVINRTIEELESEKKNIIEKFGSKDSINQVITKVGKIINENRRFLEENKNVKLDVNVKEEIEKFVFGNENLNEFVKRFSEMTGISLSENTISKLKEISEKAREIPFYSEKDLVINWDLWKIGFDSIVKKFSDKVKNITKQTIAIMSFDTKKLQKVAAKAKDKIKKEIAAKLSTIAGEFISSARWDGNLYISKIRNDITDILYSNFIINSNIVLPSYVSKNIAKDIDTISFVDVFVKKRDIKEQLEALIARKDIRQIQSLSNILGLTKGVSVKYLVAGLDKVIYFKSVEMLRQYRNTLSTFMKIKNALRKSFTTMITPLSDVVLKNVIFNTHKQLAKIISTSRRISEIKNEVVRQVSETIQKITGKKFSDNAIEQLAEFIITSGAENFLKHGFDYLRSIRDIDTLKKFDIDTLYRKVFVEKDNLELLATHNLMEFMVFKGRKFDNDLINLIKEIQKVFDKNDASEINELTYSIVNLVSIYDNVYMNANKHSMFAIPLLNLVRRANAMYAGDEEMLKNLVDRINSLYGVEVAKLSDKKMKITVSPIYTKDSVLMFKPYTKGVNDNVLLELGFKHIDTIGRAFEDKIAQKAQQLLRQHAEAKSSISFDEFFAPEMRYFKPAESLARTNFLVLSRLKEAKIELSVLERIDPKYRDLVSQILQKIDKEMFNTVVNIGSESEILEKIFKDVFRVKMKVDSVFINDLLELLVFKQTKNAVRKTIANELKGVYRGISVSLGDTIGLGVNSEIMGIEIGAVSKGMKINKEQIPEILSQMRIMLSKTGKLSVQYSNTYKIFDEVFGGIGINKTKADLLQNVVELSKNDVFLNNDNIPYLVEAMYAYDNNIEAFRYVNHLARGNVFSRLANEIPEKREYYMSLAGQELSKAENILKTTNINKRMVKILSVVEEFLYRVFVASEKSGVDIAKSKIEEVIKVGDMLIEEGFFKGEIEEPYILGYFLKNLVENPSKAIMSIFPFTDIKMFIPQKIVEDINTYVIPFIYDTKKQETILSSFTKINGVIRRGFLALFPSFYIQNLLDSLVKNVLYGVSPDAILSSYSYIFGKLFKTDKKLLSNVYKDIVRHTLGGKTVDVNITTVEGVNIQKTFRAPDIQNGSALRFIQSLAPENILSLSVSVDGKVIRNETFSRFAKVNGVVIDLERVFSEAIATKSIDFNLVELILNNRTLLEYIRNNLSKNKVGYFIRNFNKEILSKVNGVIEQANRFSLYIDRKTKGYSIGEIRREIDKLHFDYSRISDFERRVMNEVFFFYTFFRKTLNLTFKVFIEKATAIANALKVRYATEIDEASIGRRGLFLPFATNGNLFIAFNPYRIFSPIQNIEIIEDILVNYAETYEYIKTLAMLNSSAKGVNTLNLVNIADILLETMIDTVSPVVATFTTMMNPLLKVVPMTIGVGITGYAEFFDLQGVKRPLIILGNKVIPISDRLLYLMTSFVRLNPLFGGGSIENFVLPFSFTKYNVAVSVDRILKMNYSRSSVNTFIRTILNTGLIIDKETQKGYIKEVVVNDLARKLKLEKEKVRKIKADIKLYRNYTKTKME